MATHQKTAMLLTKRGTETLNKLENYTDLGIGVNVRWSIGLGQIVIGTVSVEDTHIATISGSTYNEVVSSINAFIAGWKSSR